LFGRVSQCTDGLEYGSTSHKEIDRVALIGPVSPKEVCCSRFPSVPFHHRWYQRCIILTACGLFGRVSQCTDGLEWIKEEKIV
jgi:hypothetical protein